MTRRWRRVTYRDGKRLGVPLTLYFHHYQSNVFLRKEKGKTFRILEKVKNIQVESWRGLKTWGKATFAICMTQVLNRVVDVVFYLLSIYLYLVYACVFILAKSSHVFALIGNKIK